MKHLRDISPKISYSYVCPASAKKCQISHKFYLSREETADVADFWLRKSQIVFHEHWNINETCLFILLWTNYYVNSITDFNMKIIIWAFYILTSIVPVWSVQVIIYIIISNRRNMSNRTDLLNYTSCSFLLLFNIYEFLWYTKTLTSLRHYRNCIL